MRTVILAFRVILTRIGLGCRKDENPEWWW